MCQITVTNMDGKPVADRTVLLDLNENYLANYTTDKNGTAAFSIDTSNIFDPSFKLSVSKYSLIPEKILHWREGLEGIGAGRIVSDEESRQSLHQHLQPV